MERLPYIDEHTRVVAADRDATWAALVAVLRGTDQPLWRGYARLVGCDPADANGDWRRRELPTGATLPGFAVAKARAPERLVLAGRHRFARYELTFVLEPIDGSAGATAATRLRAETRAAFPGITGGIYRALVITSRAHVIATRRILSLVARCQAVRSRAI
jgi:hypothetical protein